MNENDKTITRSIRSFVRREGRISQRQKFALESLWTIYGIDFCGKVIDLKKIFSGSGEVVVDIGFGNGQSLLVMAKMNPSINFLGIEVYRPGIATLMLALKERNIQNVRICQQDAVEVLQEGVADATLSGINIFFPDPWPKKRHHKRRLIQPNFMSLAVQKLKIGGRLRLATDWEDYAIQMMSILSSFNSLKNLAGISKFLTSRNYRSVTKFEERGRRLGHKIWDLDFIKQDNLS